MTTTDPCLNMNLSNTPQHVESKLIDSTWEGTKETYFQQSDRTNSGSKKLCFSLFLAAMFETVDNKKDALSNVL